MRIGIVAPSAVPYVRGGYERLCSGLVDHLNEHTEHEAELFKLPFPENDLLQVVDGYRRFSGLGDLGVDLVITGKYPAWCVEHPNHVVYMAHPLRGLYDTYPSHLGREAHPDAEEDRLWYDTLGADASFDEVLARFERLVERLGADHPAFAYPGPLARAVVHALDRIALAPGRIRRYAAISATVAGRPDYFPPRARVAAVHPPASLPPAAPPEARSGFFTASRLDQPKRLDLLIEAMARVRTDVRLRIAGTGPESDRLKDLAAGDPRVEFLGFVSDEQLAGLYAGALAVPFVPLDEDLGLIALEAMASGTPVVTTYDSGGPAELIKDAVTGLVVEPTVDAIAAALDRLSVDRDLAECLGQAGRVTAASVTWAQVANRLLGTSRPTVPRDPWPTRTTGRPRLVALSTYNIQPALHGGQLRCLHLFEGLMDDFDVRALCLVEPDAPTREVPNGSGFVEIQIPRTRRHNAVEWERSAEVGIPMGDLYGGEHIELTPAFLDAVAKETQAATAVVLAHPYLMPSIEQVGLAVPLVYDAHNCEAVLKSEALPHTVAGDAARVAVADVEGRAVRAANLLSLCSAADRNSFVRLYGELPPTHLAPNGVDVTSTRFVSGDERVRLRRRWLTEWRSRSIGSAVSGHPQHVALFIGSWHPPNLQAARIIHTLAADRPEVLFVMAGGHTIAFAASDVPPNVAELGAISDLTKATLLSLASVALNPMVSGSGTNLKLVEYLAAGVPTVTTRHGARGVFDDREDEVCLLAEPDAFADAVGEILVRRPEELDEIILRGRRLVEREFDWQQISRSLASALVDVLDLGRRAILQ